MEREPDGAVVRAEPVEAYEPPGVAWEEPFEPTAASCCYPDEPGCTADNYCP